MSWIKRNLFFVIGSAIAVALMGVAGYYLYSQWEDNEQKWSAPGGIKEHADKLLEMSRIRPHPGVPPVDNIKTATEQQAKLRDWVQQARKGLFKAIDPIPSFNTRQRVTDSVFNSSLLRTMRDLETEAKSAYVALPTNNWAWSFTAQKQLVTYKGNLYPVAVQVGEVKAICGVLFGAGIEELAGLQREPASPDDSPPLANPNDYVNTSFLCTVTNRVPGIGLAVVQTPYQVTFRCSTARLAGVMAGFANSPHFFIVKTVDVVPAESVVALGPVGVGFGAYPPPPPVTNKVTSTGLPTALSERQLQVSMTVNVVKLLDR